MPKKKITAGATKDLPFKALEAKGFEIRFVSHARSILAGEFADALIELGKALDELTLPITEIIGSGGGETKFTQRLRKSLWTGKSTTSRSRRRSTACRENRRRTRSTTCEGSMAWE